MNLGIVWKSIVNDSEIIRMFNTEFDSLLPQDKKGITFYPEKLAKEIDGINDWVYDTINNGYFFPFERKVNIVFINVGLQRLKRRMKITYFPFLNLSIASKKYSPNPPENTFLGPLSQKPIFVSS
jgi:hypothetical protein